MTFVEQKLFRLNASKKDRLIDLLKQSLAPKNEIIFSYLHGSFVESSSFRDVDIAVWVAYGSVGRVEVLDYEISLSLELEDIMGFPVDTKVLNYAPLGFRYHVTKGLMLTSRDDNQRSEFVERTWNEYLDFKPKSELFLLEMLL